MVNMDKKEIISAQTPVDGNFADSHRAELTEAISYLTFLNIMQEEYEHKKCFKYSCGNKGVIQIAQSTKTITPNQWGRKHVDLQETLRKLRGKLKYNKTFNHISAHQDKNIEPLNIEAHINILCIRTYIYVWRHVPICLYIFIYTYMY